jgi:hypothetical protein
MPAEMDLAPIKAREAAATPGPWGHAYRPDGTTTVWHVDPESGRLTVAEVRGWDRHAENAAFIAHARADVPALVAEVEQLRAERLLLARLATPRAELSSAEIEAALDLRDAVIADAAVAGNNTRGVVDRAQADAQRRADNRLALRAIIDEPAPEGAEP